MTTPHPPIPPARCVRLLSRLSSYVDGDLTPVQRRTIERHCRDCARCRRMIASLRRTIALCRASRLPLTPRARTRAHAAIARVLSDNRG
ncbi:MAG TPA: zf-HC2 domain-containing protein [Vicinamibacterales bacterium]|nr:zf-HC2 domain-containing protein [Vicinamibacterales bacterium]